MEITFFRATRFLCVSSEEWKTAWQWLLLLLLYGDAYGKFDPAMSKCVSSADCQTHTHYVSILKPALHSGRRTRWSCSLSCVQLQLNPRHWLAEQNQQPLHCDTKIDLLLRLDIWVHWYASLIINTPAWLPPAADSDSGYTDPRCWPSWPQQRAGIQYEKQCNT